MKKILSIFVMAFFALAICAQDSAEHLKFMGIELNGPITDFQKKLLAKGLTVSSSSNQLPAGMRSFDGTFSGEEAEIIVFYNTRSKEVYRAKAMISRKGKDSIEQLMSKMGSKLDAKYGTDSKISDKVKDDYLQEFTQYNYITGNGSIGLFISSTGYSDQSLFYLQIDYQDKVNLLKNTQDEMDDL